MTAFISIPNMPVCFIYLFLKHVCPKQDKLFLDNVWKIGFLETGGNIYTDFKTDQQTVICNEFATIMLWQ